MKTKHQHEVARIVRKESAHLTGAIVRYLGSQHLMLAEDVVQDAIVAALSTWSPENLPDHPRAWLRRVATNRAIDTLRRRNRELEWRGDDTEAVALTDLNKLDDPELHLLYLTCNETLPPIDQVILSLNVVAGFSAANVAELLLRETPAIAQRLVRMKRKLRKVSSLTTLKRDHLTSRIEPMLRAIYLIFCAGYLPPSGNELLRAEILEDALLLAESLMHQTGDGRAAALSSLIALQASRSESRQRDNHLVDLKTQNRDEWDKALISRGIHHLRASQQSADLSCYHLEAAIAAEHATAAAFADTNWHHIELLYDQLERMTDSPVVTVSAALANLYAGHPEQCQARLDGLATLAIIDRYAPYHTARARLLKKKGRVQEALQADLRAHTLQKNLTVRAYLEDHYLS